MFRLLLFPALITPDESTWHTVGLQSMVATPSTIIIVVSMAMSRLGLREAHTSYTGRVPEECLGAHPTSYRAFTGKVYLDHLSQNHLGCLLKCRSLGPPHTYQIRVSGGGAQACVCLPSFQSDSATCPDLRITVWNKIKEGTSSGRFEPGLEGQTKCGFIDSYFHTGRVAGGLAGM